MFRRPTMFHCVGIPTSSHLFGAGAAQTGGGRQTDTESQINKCERTPAEVLFETRREAMRSKLEIDDIRHGRYQRSRAAYILR